MTKDEAAKAVLKILLPYTSWWQSHEHEQVRAYQILDAIREYTHPQPQASPVYKLKPYYGLARYATYTDPVEGRYTLVAVRQVVKESEQVIAENISQEDAEKLAGQFF